MYLKDARACTLHERRVVDKFQTHRKNLIFSTKFELQTKAGSSDWYETYIKLILVFLSLVRVGANWHQFGAKFFLMNFVIPTATLWDNRQLAPIGGVWRQLAPNWWCFGTNLAPNWRCFGANLAPNWRAIKWNLLELLKFLAPIGANGPPTTANWRQLAPKSAIKQIFHITDFALHRENYPR